LRFDYYRDANTAFEAFKKGEADVRVESDPSRWTSGYDFPAVSEGKVIKETIEQRSPAPASGFAFNTRRKLFENVHVREALVLAFDFEWANTNLFGGAYRRTYGYFSGSALSSKGVPADDQEKSIIGDGLPAAHMDGSYALPASDGSGKDRKLLRAAVGKLAEAGWTIQDGVMKNAAGEAVAFATTITNKDQEKIALHFQRTLEQIGIRMDVKLVDAAQFAAVQKTYDYDMIPVTWFNSLSPGPRKAPATIRASLIPRWTPPLKSCCRPRREKILPPPCAPKTASLLRATTSSRSMMPGDNGWPAGATLDGQRNSRCRGLKQQHCGEFRDQD
jgi:peptide/nickel transport system substrate-binding protein